VAEEIDTEKSLRLRILYQFQSGHGNFGSFYEMDQNNMSLITLENVKFIDNISSLSVFMIICKCTRSCDPKLQ
jgi:hypothetical protein